jgi:Zn-dependent metalloprotease
MRALLRSDGQTAVEYMGMLLVTAAIIAAIAQTDVPGRLRYELVRTVCLTLNGERSCAPPYKVERRRREERRTLLAHAASQRDRDRKAREDKHGRRWIYDSRGRRLYRQNLVRRNGDGPSARREANRVFSNLGRVYDDWYLTFGRKSYDGKGSPLVATVRFRFDPEEPFRNAFWDPDHHQMAFGEGYGASLDATAHEIAHGVILSELPGFSYKGENGALGEAIADMFASNIDQNWTIGEHLPGGALRDMEHPERVRYVDRDSGRRVRPPAHTRDYVKTPIDKGGVHINAGIPNRAYVNMVESLGRDASERILYDAVTKYLKSDAGFEDFRAACLKATTDPETHKAVDAAFRQVGLDGTWRPPR